MSPKLKSDSLEEEQGSFRNQLTSEYSNNWYIKKTQSISDCQFFWL